MYNVSSGSLRLESVNACSWKGLLVDDIVKQPAVLRGGTRHHGADSGRVPGSRVRFMARRRERRVVE